MKFTEHDLAGLFPDSWLERGRALARAGQVTRLARGSDGHSYSALVQGSRRQPYKVTIRVSRAYNKLNVAGRCACPIGHNCKHVAAVLMTACAEAQTASPSGGRDLELGRWLARLNAAVLPADNEARFAPAVTDRLLYVLAPGADGRLVANLMKARRRQSGGFGQARPWTGYSTASGGSIPAFITDADWEVVELLRSLGRALETGPGFPLQGQRGGLALRQMVATGRAYWMDPGAQPLIYGGIRSAAASWVDADGGGQRLAFQTQPAARVFPLAPPWWVDEEAGMCGEVASDLPAVVAEVLVTSPVVAADAVAWVAQSLQAMPAELPIPAQQVARHVAGITPVPVLRLTSVELDSPPMMHFGWKQPGDTMIVDVARLEFDYDGAKVACGARDDVVHSRKQGELLAISRHRVAEQAALARLTGLHFVPAAELQKHAGHALRDAYTLADEDGWADFVLQHLPELATDGWRIERESGFRWDIAEADEEWDAVLDETSGSDWFDLELGITVAGERISLLPVLAALVRDMSEAARAAIARGEDSDTGRYLAPLPSGRKVALPADRVRGMLAVLVELFDGDALDGSGRLRLSAIHAARLADIDAAARLRWLGGERLLELGRKLRAFSGVTPVVPPLGLKAELRPYQRDGLNWLQFLREYGLAGVLGDDMGLGKTLQTLAHLLAEKEAGRADRPSLVVAPTSLMFNWRREAARFAPDLRVLLLHGAERQQHFSHLDEYDLVLTTYSLLSRDSEELEACPFHLLILDEAHFIKNPKAQATQVVHRINARHRLALTGTPMENHLGELWSLYHFLLPGLLGNELAFKRVFRIPIEKYGDRLCRDALSRRIAPFLLRRTKAEVAKDLPPKTEITRTCELTGAQRDLYETIRATMQEKVRSEIEARGFKKSQIVILDALLKLRQVCCDPRLLAIPAARRVRESAKLELLLSLLPDMLAEGRRILVFSQFTSMLSLIEAELEERDIDFVKLNGQTRDRETPVNRFQAGEVPLFLISLRAGGTGLNLTAADTVIHFDPWWNPAVEDQATGRAHRIGQTNPVFVYKLYTEGTVEEKIIALQERKRAMASGVLGDGTAATATLTAEDLQGLFESLGE